MPGVDFHRCAFDSLGWERKFGVHVKMSCMTLAEVCCLEWLLARRRLDFQDLTPNWTKTVLPFYRFDLCTGFTWICGQDGVFVVRTVSHIAVVHNAAIIIGNSVVARSLYFVEVEFSEILLRSGRISWVMRKKKGKTIVSTVSTLP